MNGFFSWGGREGRGFRRQIHVDRFGEGRRGGRVKADICSSPSLTPPPAPPPSKPSFTHNAIHVRNPSVCCSIAMEWRHQRGVNCKLHAPKRGRRPSATISNLREDLALGTVTFVVTLAPSRHILAPALSTAKPRRPKTPARVHDARWWLKASKRRPHRHARAPRGSENAERRRINPGDKLDGGAENPTANVPVRCRPHGASIGRPTSARREQLLHAATRA